MSDRNDNITRDASRNVVQVPGSFVTQDATGTPQTSPLSYTDTASTIVVPANAIEFVVFPTTDMRISDQSDMTPYDVVALGTKEVFPCAKMTNIYVVRDSVNGSLRFRFNLL